MVNPESGALRIGAGAAAAGLLFAMGGSTSSTEVPMPDKYQATPACYEPTAAEQATVDQLFTRRPLYQRDPSYKNMHWETVQAAVSKRLGMTLVPYALEQKVELDYFNHAPYKTIFHDTKTYLEKFGVQLRLAQPEDLKSDDAGDAPTKHDLHDIAARYDITEIAEGFQELPVEYVRATGLKTILLIANTSGDAAYAEITGPDNTVAVDITAGQAEPGPQLLDHEMYHLLDRRECSSTDGQYTDPGYTALNGGDIYHKTDHAGKLAFDSPEVTKLEDRLINKEQTKIHSPAAQADQQAYYRALRNVASYSLYGFTNAVEDKAEVGRNIAIPADYSTLLSNSTPLIKQKFEYLLARLYHYQPAVVRYLAAVSTRPDAQQYQILHKPAPGSSTASSK